MHFAAPAVSRRSINDPAPFLQGHSHILSSILAFSHILTPHVTNQRNACRAYWDAAQDNAEVRNSVNTRITYKSVFEHFRRRLEAVGVTTERQFRAILHSAQSRECEDRRRALEAKRDAAHFYRTT